MIFILKERSAMSYNQTVNMEKLCGICSTKEARYKCPKCGIRYCSLGCFKDEVKHSHTDIDAKKEEDVIKEEVKTTNGIKSLKFDSIYQNSKQLQDLLQYKTVKFHLYKVYKILNVRAGALGTSDLSSSAELKRQLAVDYLNTLREGGVHHNEAVEDFCQLCLKLLSED
ncbi:LAMI_0G03444g1_1 [Lachancea mirantina]|uniref:LAMI_0G03444g1_1 n=1 Tax=Lachancea mirantina TaxID=1230905 RepID=A0A1G4K861_9SACH|nr:LAMI_0G03444g1_1 [Lachancea mirantina]